MTYLAPPIPQGTSDKSFLRWDNTAKRWVERTIGGAYTPANATTDRAFDATAYTMNELANVLGTLITDLLG